MAAEILRECANWIRQQNTIHLVAPSNGGWEKWAQLDFGAYLKTKSYRVTHDDRCFSGNGNGEMADFTVHGHACVDLKAFGYQYNTPELIQAYKARLQTSRQIFGRFGLNSECRDNDKFCIGIANLDDLVAGLRYVYNVANINSSNFMKPLKNTFGPEYEHAVIASVSGARWVISFCKVD